MFRRRWAGLALMFAGSAATLALVAWGRVLGPSPHFHFLDLANSFLNGRLDTDTPKRTRGMRPRPDDPRGLQDAVNRHVTGPGGRTVGWNDWASIHVITLTDGTVVKGVFPWSDAQTDQRNRFRTLDGEERIIDRNLDIKRGCGGPGGLCHEVKYYVSFPPFPAIVMMPLFLIFGYDTNDVLLTIFFAAANAVLILLLLEALRMRGLSGRSPRENFFLAILFAFGTVHFFSSVRGEVWFTALILGVTLNLLFIMAAIETRHPFLAGVALACGMATRTPLVFASLFFLLELFRDGERSRWPGWKTVLRKGSLFAAPMLVTGLALMAYNFARFESFGEFGHTYLAGGTRPSIREHGLFSFWFLKNNLAAALTNPPVLDSYPPYIHITRHGLSLFFCSPVLLYVFWPRRWSAFARNAAVTAFVVAIPSLFYQNTGWAQFGYRFALDYMPYLFVLLAVCARPFTRAFCAAAVISFAMNLLGAITFDRMPAFYYD